MDPPPAAVVEAFSTSGTERGYPPSIGSAVFRGAVARWIERRFGVDVPIAADRRVHRQQGVRRRRCRSGCSCARPDRDTVLYPATSYPTYEMGAILAGCRPVPVAMRPTGGIDLASIDRRRRRAGPRAVGQQPGQPDRRRRRPRRRRRVGSVATACPVFSDECYVEFTWDGPGRSILEHGLEGVVAVHSLSKRSNLAGGRVGFYAGDPELVHYLQEVRKHVGMMVPGPAQAAGVVALDDDAHVEVQRGATTTAWSGWPRSSARGRASRSRCPAGGFYLWFPVDDGWAFAERLAAEGGAIVSPGEFYGVGAEDHVRVAVVQPDERIELVAERLGV